MRNYLTLLAFVLLIGSLSAQSTLAGSLQGSNGIWHKIYITDAVSFPTGHGTAILVNGVYLKMKDGSPGYIEIERQAWGLMAKTLAHEMCHARQDDEHRPLDEKECH